MIVSKNSILYFSGTGNTYDISMRLTKKCGFELINVTSLMGQEVIEMNCEYIGFAFPVYCGGIPQVVGEIISNVKFLNNPYIFGIATYGGIPGNPFAILKQSLEQQNIGLDAGFLINMPRNYLPTHGARKKKVQLEQFEKADKKINEIIEIIGVKKALKYEELPHIPSILEVKYTQIVKKRVRGLATLDRHFNVDSTCNHCGMCVKICPVRNIDMKTNQVNWLGKCEQCMACIQYCPQEAIQYGNKTTRRDRYKNPNVDYLKVLLKQE